MKKIKTMRIIKFYFFVFNKKVRKEFCFKISRNSFLMKKIVKYKNNLLVIFSKNISIIWIYILITDKFLKIQSNLDNNNHKT